MPASCRGWWAGRRDGLPVNAMWLLAVLGTAFAMLPGINELLSFGSITFLGVFGLINHLQARTADGTADRVLGHVGAAACGAAIVVVCVRLAADDPTTLAMIAGTALGVLVLRLVYVRTHDAAGVDGPVANQ